MEVKLIWGHFVYVLTVCIFTMSFLSLISNLVCAAQIHDIIMRKLQQLYPWARIMVNVEKLPPISGGSTEGFKLHREIVVIAWIKCVLSLFLIMLK